MIKKMLLGGLLLFVNICPSMSYASSGFFTDRADIVGRDAPDFVLKTLMRDKQSMKELIKGKKAMILFWATWCPYCRKELATLSQNMPDIKKKGIELIFVNVGETPKQVRSFVEKNKIKADVFLDEDSVVAQKYEVLGLPTFFYVNKNGVVNAMENALLDDYEEELSKE